MCNVWKLHQQISGYDVKHFCCTCKGTFIYKFIVCVKGMHTFGNCQKPGFSLGVSQHMHIVTNLWKF